MISAQEKLFTIEDIYALPEGERAELIDGQIYYMAPPSRKHQRHCEVDIAPFAVFLNEHDKTYVEPDISVICDPDKLDDRGCNGAPDWILEIVSPGSRQMDYFIKLFKYRSAGVREYWIVDPEKNRITVWNFESNHTEEFSFSDSVPAGIYEDFTINFSKLNL